MVRVFVYILVGILLLFSCKNHGGNNGMHKAEIPFALIKNESLVREIKLYINSVNIPTLKNKIVQVSISQFEDTTVYKLYYATCAFGLIITPSTFYTKVDEELIAISYDGVKEIGLSESVAWEYLKEVFPEEFNYYQVYNDYPPPPTSREIVWILTFKEGMLIEKQEIIN